MNKEQAITKLTDFKRDLDEMEKFAGKAAQIKSIEKKIQFLSRYMAVDNIPELFVNEIDKELQRIKGE